MMNTEPIKFSSWGGLFGISKFIYEQTGCKPYSGAGINPRINKKVTILKSVDNTYFYDDDLSDINNPKYTLFGHNGDQSESEKRFNEPLLNPEKTEHIYLYRVTQNKKNKEYLWYGKYIIDKKEIKNNIGKDYCMRKIIVLSLKRIL